MIRIILAMQLCFFVGAGFTWQAQSVKNVQNVEFREVMASLMSHSIGELGKIRVDSI